MAFFKEDDRKQITAILKEKMSGKVGVDLFIKKDSRILIPGRAEEECPYCESLVEMFAELSGLSDDLEYRVHVLGEDAAADKDFGVTEVPAIVFNGKKKGRMIFYGIPSGYEFASLLEVLGAVSSGKESVFSPEMSAYLETLDKKLDFKVFVTPSCPYCPAAALSALLAARLNENISAEVYEVSEFSEIGQKYHVEGVPKTVINERVEIVGGYPESVLREKIENEL